MMQRMTLAARDAASAALAILVLLPAMPSSAAAQDTDASRTSAAEARPVDRLARAVRIDSPPDIDGQLDEPFWQTIQPITDFVQREPVDGGTPSERTEVRIAYDERALYFGMIMHDSEPGRIRRSILHREGRIDQDDRIVIALDTYHDGRNGYVFELNSFGTQGDALFANESLTLPDWNWEGVYHSQARVTEQGWVLEVAIPFTTIRFDRSDAPSMGIALYRSIRRKNEEVFWPHIPQRYRSGIAQVSQYATLTGLQDIRRGRYIQVTPFGVVGAQKFGVAETNTINDFGVDLKYSVTSNLTLDLTYNTDFAQVEADNVQINLTRFNLFFPEKRPFFLERAQLFTLGDLRETEVFFSRRIGIVNEITGGGRVTGQVGPLSVGLLSLQTEDGTVGTGDDATLVPGANNTVLRVQGDVLPRTTVGMIATNLQNSRSWYRSLGADAAVRFWGSSSFNAWVADTRDSGPDASGAAGSINLQVRPTRLWSVDAGYTSIGTDFAPALGFVQRGDMVRYKTGASIVPRFNSTWARQLVLAVNGSYIEGQDGRRQSVDGLFHSMLGFQTGDNISFNVNHDLEDLDFDFPIRQNVIIPAGVYDWRTATASLRFNESRTFSGNASVALGNFYSGTRRQYNGRLNWKTGRHLTLSGSVNRNDIDLPVANGEFSTTILGLNVLGAISRSLFANALVQYDDASETAQSNIRINWIPRAGSNMFVVFDTGYDASDDFDPRASRWVRRTGVVKLAWQQAF
jgi:hypothetical protein